MRFRDVTKLLLEDDVQLEDVCESVDVGRVVSRDRITGNQVVRNVTSLAYGGQIRSAETSNVFKGVVRYATHNVGFSRGDCGSPLILSYGRNQMIVGIHFMGMGSADPTINGVSVLFGLSHVKDACDVLYALETGPPTPLQFRHQSFGKDLVLGDVHEKNFAHKIANDENVSIYGQFVGMSLFSDQSELKPSVFSSYLSESHGVPNLYGPPPDMGSSRHYERIMRIMNSNGQKVSFHVCAVAYADMKQKFLEVIGQHNADFSRVRVLTNNEALNGVPGCVEPMNKKTSMGFPVMGPKEAWLLTDASVDASMHNVLKEEFQTEIEEIENVYKSGFRPGTVFMATYKDEAVKRSKTKTRVFFAGPAVFTFLCRKYLGFLSSMIVKHNFLFENAVGIDAHSDKWDELYVRMTSFAGNNICGDFGDYDATLYEECMAVSHKIVVDMCSACGYTELELLVVKGLLTDLLFPLVCCKGVLWEFNGPNVSGQPLTTIINGFCGSFNMRYVFYKKHPHERLVRFDTVVRLVMYGDDNWSTVKNTHTWFNQNAIKDTLSDVGMVYTDANKSVGALCEFTPVEEVSFLKRGFKFSTDLGYVVAPLELNSLYKMLHWRKRSEISSQEHAKIVAHACVCEALFHGREVYEELQRVMIDALGVYSISPTLTTILPYDRAVTQWVQNPKKESNGCIDR